MAKIVKVKLTRVQNNGRIQNSYPAEYDPTKIQIIAYEGISDASKPYCIGVVKDADLDSFIVSNDIEEINQQEAETLGTLWSPRLVKIIDHDKILMILEKVRTSEALTIEDEDAIDPDNNSFGINKTEPFINTLSEGIEIIDGK